MASGLTLVSAGSPRMPPRVVVRWRGAWALTKLRGSFAAHRVRHREDRGLIEGHVGARGERRVDPRTITRRAMPRRAVRRVRCPGACRSGADTARLRDHSRHAFDRRATTGFFSQDFLVGTRPVKRDASGSSVAFKISTSNSPASWTIKSQHSRWRGAGARARSPRGRTPRT